MSGPGVLLELRFCREDNTSSWENSRVDTISFVYGEEGRLLGIDVSDVRLVSTLQSSQGRSDRAGGVWKNNNFDKFR